MIPMSAMRLRTGLPILLAAGILVGEARAANDTVTGTIKTSSGTNAGCNQIVERVRSERAHSRNTFSLFLYSRQRGADYVTDNDGSILHLHSSCSKRLRSFCEKTRSSRRNCRRPRSILTGRSGKT